MSAVAAFIVKKFLEVVANVEKAFSTALFRMVIADV